MKKNLMKLAGLLLAMTMMLGLASCGQQGAQESQPASSNPAQTGSVESAGGGNDGPRTYPHDVMVYDRAEWTSFTVE